MYIFFGILAGLVRTYPDLFPVLSILFADAWFLYKSSLPDHGRTRLRKQGKYLFCVNLMDDFFLDKVRSQGRNKRGAVFSRAGKQIEAPRQSPRRANCSGGASHRRR